MGATKHPQFFAAAGIFLTLAVASTAQQAAPAAESGIAPAAQMTPRAYYLRGTQKAGAGDLDGAIADFSQTIAMNPNNFQAFQGRANAERMQKKLDAALADYGKAIAINSQYGPAYFYRAVAEREKGDLDAAIADYDQVLKLDPKNVGAYNNRGLAKQGKGDLAGATADFRKAVEIDPKDANAAKNLAAIEKKSGGDSWGMVEKPYGDTVLKIYFPNGFSERAGPVNATATIPLTNEFIAKFFGPNPLYSLNVEGLAVQKTKNMTADEFKAMVPGLEKKFSANSNPELSEKLKAADEATMKKFNAAAKDDGNVSGLQQLFLETFDKSDQHLSILTLSRVELTRPGSKTTATMAGSMTVAQLKGKVIYFYVAEPFVGKQSYDEVKALTKELISREEAANR